MTIREILDYEIRSSRLMKWPFLLPGWMTTLIARHLGRRTLRKVAAFNADIDRQERLRARHPQLVKLATPRKIT